MHYTGITFRPPFEEKSLLVQATVGCSHNKCAFCRMYRDLKFQPSPMEEIEEDIRFIGKHRTLFKRMFLVGGDPFALPYERLRDIALLTHEQLPRIETIGCYATIRNVLHKTPEQLKDLADLGYNNLNIGIESGLYDVLQDLNKGYSLDDAREALRRLQDAGIKYTANIIIGAAGSGRGAEHAKACAALLNEFPPDIIIVTPLHVDAETELADRVSAGDFDVPTLREIIVEERDFLLATDLQETNFFGLHELNPVRINGLLGRDREFLADELDKAIDRFPEFQLDQPMPEPVKRRQPQ